MVKDKAKMILGIYTALLLAFFLTPLAMVVISSPPSFMSAFKPNRPLFFPEKVTNWVPGRDNATLPASTFWTISSSSPV